MTKAAFIENIRQITSYLPVNEREKYVEYYSEMIDDAVEDGMSEEEAVASLGTIEEISAYIRENSAQSIQSPAPESVVREKKTFACLGNSVDSAWFSDMVFIAVCGFLNIYFRLGCYNITVCGRYKYFCCGDSFSAGIVHGWEPG